MADQASNSEPKKSFKDTLNLPQTAFPIRPNHKIDDRILLDRWQEEKLYDTSFELNKGNQKYILHDGPPYTNGDIHLGHAYNKILKDFVCKSRRMSGYQVPVTPGWDCHGLPIEQKVVQENPDLKDNRFELIKACRKYSNHWIDVQRQSFKDLGVLMDWEHPYITMAYHYESSIIKAFGIFVSKGFIERKNKTVPWCFHCQTVLAAAEIEHENRKDPSIYVLFTLEDKDSKRLFGEIDKPISIVVWTTTPWTLPLNQAVLIKPKSKYVLLEINNNYYIVGAQVADKLCALLQVDKKIIKEFNSDYLVDLYLKHPFLNKTVPIIFDESVGLDDGTAFVHCAPGCGPLDYEIGVKNSLEIFSPISSDGKYTELIEPKELNGMLVTDGQIWVIKKLIELNKLIYKTTVNHSYPHCWRCHNGLIFRATPQWFFNLDKEGVKQNALKAIDKIEFIPERGRNFLKATVESRWEWCLSRQRVWGVPIPAILCKNCDSTYLNEELIEKVAQGVLKEGIEFWEKIDIKDLIQNITCLNCKKSDFKKEKDILDVWFDSGISHYAVLYNNPKLAFPADIYLEGLDQHRGWFQSSLLTSLVLENQAAMKTIMTHGYTVDAEGRKMSKSLGNVVVPSDIINQIGTDGLRLWVASIGYDSDPTVSEVLLRNVAEVYRKIRVTCRFLLSNLNDFDPKVDSVSISKLLPVDYYALTQISKLNINLINSYRNCDFTAVFHSLADYCSVELSSFYLDIVKDRLYVERANSLERRSAQTVLWSILDTLNRLIAPIMSFTAELISDNYQKNKSRSIHLQSFIDPEKLQELVNTKKDSLWLDLFVKALPSKVLNIVEQPESTDLDAQWQAVKYLRSLILKAIEAEREKGLIKHPLEANIKIAIDFSQKKLEPLKELIESLPVYGITIEIFFKELLVVSQFALVDNIDVSQNPTGISITVNKAEGIKCPRCWQWDFGSDSDDLCRRCQRVLKK